MAQAVARVPADTDALLHHSEVLRVIRAIAIEFGIRAEQDIEDFVGDVQKRALETTPPGERPTDVPGWKALVREVAYNVGRETVKMLCRRGKYNIGPTDRADDHATKSSQSILEPHERAAIRAIVEEVLREQAGGRHTGVALAGIMTGAPPREMAKDAGISPGLMRKQTSKLRKVLRNRFVMAGIALAGVSVLALGGVEGFHQYQAAQQADSFDANCAAPRWEPMTDEPPRFRDLPDSDKAARLREQATDECGRKDWEPCARDLDMARLYDPSIDEQPDVQAMRKLINTYFSAKPRFRK
jgi:hypothetical protein